MGNYDDVREAGPLGIKGRDPESKKASWRRLNQHCPGGYVRVGQFKREGKGVPGRGNHTSEGPKVREEQGHPREPEVPKQLCWAEEMQGPRRELGEP